MKAALRIVDSDADVIEPHHIWNDNLD